MPMRILATQDTCGCPALRPFGCFSELLVSFFLYVLWVIAIRQLGTLLYFYNLFEHSGQAFCFFDPVPVLAIDSGELNVQNFGLWH